MRADDILTTAAALVGGERRVQHGDARKIFSMTTALFEDLTGVQMDPRDAIVFMVCLKLARIHGGAAHNIDNYIDAAGYIALAGQYEAEEQERKKSCE